MSYGPLYPLPPGLAPPAPPEAERWWQRRWVIAVVCLVVGIIIGSAVASGDNTSSASQGAASPTPVTVTATERAQTNVAPTGPIPPNHRHRPSPTQQHHGHHPSRGHQRQGAHHHRHHVHIPVDVPVQHAGVPAAAVPDPSLTPGDVLTTNAATVCVVGYSGSVRDVPDSLSEEAYTRYGVPHVPYQHEVDHLISLELGGSNDITNLWPEPYAGRWGARTKDVLENKLHDLVCAGSLGLRAAQRMETADWVTAYKRYVGTPPEPSSPTTAPATTTSPPAAPRPIVGGCEPGYSPCLPRVSDLDCGEIDPAKFPIAVTGDDPYGLDADGDGLGCTS